MNKIPVEGQPGLYRDENSGAILNCSDTQYKKYLELKNIKKRQLSEIDDLKSKVSQIEEVKKDVEELKSMISVLINKIT
jgi:hypothetical protein